MCQAIEWIILRTVSAAKMRSKKQNRYKIKLTSLESNSINLFDYNVDVCIGV